MIIYQFCELSSLQNQLDMKAEMGDQFDEMDIWKIIASVITGLMFSYSFQRKHNGIKPSNILWKKDGTYCLSDFGISKMYHATWPKDAARLTVDYTAPEVLEGVTVQKRTDEWSLGVVCYQLCMLTLPFSNPSDKLDQIVHNIMFEEPQPIPENIGYSAPLIMFIH